MVPTSCVQWLLDDAILLRGTLRGRNQQEPDDADNLCAWGCEGQPCYALKPQIPPTHGSSLLGNGGFLRRQAKGRSSSPASWGALVSRGAKSVPSDESNGRLRETRLVVGSSILQSRRTVPSGRS